jgi:hypothetical protein
MHLAELCSASRVVYDRSVSTVVKPNNLISYRNIYHNTRKRFYVCTYHSASAACPACKLETHGALEH